MVDLNVDIGEGFPYDEQLLEFATSANICCGEHAGSWELTVQTTEMCERRGVRIGCHPGFPDRQNFGRLVPPASLGTEYLKSVRDQIERFSAAFPAKYIKPHGAYYNILCHVGYPEGIDRAFFGACMVLIHRAVIRTGLPAMLMPLSIVAEAIGGSVSKVNALGRMVGVEPGFPPRIITEGFADRRYRPDGALVSRSEPNAILQDQDEIRRQVLELAPKIDSICLHGDTPNCLEFAELVKRTLVDAGYEVGY